MGVWGKACLSILAFLCVPTITSARAQSSAPAVPGTSPATDAPATGAPSAPDPPSAPDAPAADLPPAPSTASAPSTPSAAAPFALEATLGYKTGRTSASNGTVEFTRLPVDVLVSLTLGHTRLGFGATMHFHPSAKRNVATVYADEVAFDDALGFLLQFAHTLPFSSTHGIDLGARYTSIKYSVSEGQMAPVSKFDGSSAGLFVGIRL